MLVEGVLLRDHSYGIDKELVRFLYQRLGDHAQAQALCEKHATVEQLTAVCAKLAEQSRRNSGILYALAIASPERYGRELYELVQDDTDSVVAEAFVDSIVWRHPESFPAAWPRDYMNRVCQSTQGLRHVLEAVLQVSCLPGHPYNAVQLHRLLWKVPLPDRDATWSIFLHEHYDTGSVIGRLIDWGLEDHARACSAEVAILCATALSWFLTSSNRYLRDKATKSLVNLLQDKPETLLQLLDRFDGVDDPYVAERLYAVAYGVCLRRKDLTSLSLVAEGVYRHVFAGAEPPPHVLLRDYARGVIERAVKLGWSPGSERLANARPPYRSSWPLRPRPLGMLKKQYGGEFDSPYSLLWSSVMSDGIGDFHIYVIRPIAEDFLAPNQARRLAKARKHWRSEAERLWSDVLDRLEPHQLRLLEQVPQDPGTFLESLTGDVEALIEKVQDSLRHAEAIKSLSFDKEVMACWIFQRVLHYGWSHERFGRFDRGIGSGRARDDHGVERIGKKYQWMALHEVVAHIADHCKLKDWNDATADYEGPWQLRLREIDPSLAPSTLVPTRSAPQTCWWVRAQVEFPVPLTEERREWTTRDSGFPDAATLIETRSDSGREWLVLASGYLWDEPLPAEVARSGAEHCRVWCQLRSYVVRSSDRPALGEWFASDGRGYHRMGDEPDMYRTFIGEYPWHISSREAQLGWAIQEPDRCAVQTLFTSARYVCEAGETDRSIDETIHARVPASGIVDALKLRWAGIGFRYEDEAGDLVAFDPSAESEGPSALLISRIKLEAWHEQENLAVIWVMRGEKQLFSGHGVEIRVFHGVYSWDGGALSRMSFVTHPLRDEMNEDRSNSAAEIKPAG